MWLLWFVSAGILAQATPDPPQTKPSIIDIEFNGRASLVLDASQVAHFADHETPDPLVLQEINNLRLHLLHTLDAHISDVLSVTPLISEEFFNSARNAQDGFFTRTFHQIFGTPAPPTDELPYHVSVGVRLYSPVETDISASRSSFHDVFKSRDNQSHQNSDNQNSDNQSSDLGLCRTPLSKAVTTCIAVLPQCIGETSPQDVLHGNHILLQLSNGTQIRVNSTSSIHTPARAATTPATTTEFLQPMQLLASPIALTNLPFNSDSIHSKSIESNKAKTRVLSSTTSFDYSKYQNAKHQYKQSIQPVFDKAGRPMGFNFGNGGGMVLPDGTSFNFGGGGGVYVGSADNSEEPKSDTLKKRSQSEIIQQLAISIDWERLEKIAKAHDKPFPFELTPDPQTCQQVHTIMDISICVETCLPQFLTNGFKANSPLQFSSCFRNGFVKIIGKSSAQFLPLLPNVEVLTFRLANDATATHNDGLTPNPLTPDLSTPDLSAPPTPDPLATPDLWKIRHSTSVEDFLRHWNAFLSSADFGSSEVGSCTLAHHLVGSACVELCLTPSLVKFLEVDGCGGFGFPVFSQRLPQYSKHSSFFSSSDIAVFLPFHNTDGSAMDPSLAVEAPSNLLAPALRTPRVVKLNVERESKDRAHEDGAEESEESVQSFSHRISANGSIVSQGVDVIEFWRMIHDLVEEKRFSLELALERLQQAERLPNTFFNSSFSSPNGIDCLNTFHVDEDQCVQICVPSGNLVGLLDVSIGLCPPPFSSSSQELSSRVFVLQPAQHTAHNSLHLSLQDGCLEFQINKQTANALATSVEAVKEGSCKKTGNSKGVLTQFDIGLSVSLSAAFYPSSINSSIFELPTLQTFLQTLHLQRQQLAASVWLDWPSLRSNFELAEQKLRAAATGQDRQEVEALLTSLSKSLQSLATQAGFDCSSVAHRGMSVGGSCVHVEIPTCVSPLLDYFNDIQSC